jgi:hypothetical protein
LRSTYRCGEFHEMTRNNFAHLMPVSRETGIALVV